MELAVYTAILRSFEVQDLATHSNDVLRVDLKLVQEQMQQLTAAMACMHEMQETVRQLAQGKTIYSTSLSYEKLLAGTQEVQQQLTATMSRLASPKMVGALQCIVAQWMAADGLMHVVCH